MKHRMFPKLVAPGAKSGAALPGGSWVASEKIHGAQLVIGVDASGVLFGKRKAWLAADEPFFGWQLIRAELAEIARAAHEAARAPQLVIYGELYGGAYPHPDVPAVPGITAVQTGVWYAPDLHYAVFDALVAADDDDPGELLAHREVVVLALPMPPQLRAGTRQDVEALPVRFDSLVAPSLGLPPIAGNVAEGFVMKPDVRAAPDARAAAKRKIAEWDESAVFDGADAFDPRARLSLAELIAHARRLVNAPRIASARSKVGEAPAAIADEVVLDVLIDLTDAFPVAMAALGEDALLADAIRGFVQRLPGLRSD